MLKVCLNHSIVQYVDYMRGALQRGGPGEVAPFAPFKIHHCSRPLLNPNKNLSVSIPKKLVFGWQISIINLANFEHRKMSFNSLKFCHGLPFMKEC